SIWDTIARFFAAAAPSAHDRIRRPEKKRSSSPPEPFGVGMNITKLLKATAAAVVLTALSLPLAALQPPPPGGRGARTAPAGPVPRASDGRPDLHGVWLGGGPTSDIEDGLASGATIPYTALGKKTKDSRMAKDDPEANCLPAGVPRIAPYPWRILTTPNGSHMYFLFEGNIHS